MATASRPTTRTRNPFAGYEVATLTPLRLSGYTDFRAPGVPTMASKGKLVFKLAMGRTLTLAKRGKTWHWREVSQEGEFTGTVKAGLANLSRMLPRA